MGSGEYFNKVAKKWDNMREGFFSEAVRERALMTAKVEHGKLAVDIGCGTGFITEGLIGKGLKVIAVDGSKTMLEEMKKKFINIKDIEYRAGSAEKLPVLNDSADYVFLNMFLHHVELPNAAIKEMARILKTKGKLIITDLDKHNFEFLKAEHHDYWLGFDRDDIRKWFKEAGFKNVIIDCVGENCCAKSDTGDEFAAISIFVAYGEK